MSEKLISEEKGVTELITDLIDIKTKEEKAKVAEEILRKLHEEKEKSYRDYCKEVKRLSAGIIQLKAQVKALTGYIIVREKENWRG